MSWCPLLRTSMAPFDTDTAPKLVALLRSLPLRRLAPSDAADATLSTAVVWARPGADYEKPFRLTIRATQVTRHRIPVSCAWRSWWSWTVEPGWIFDSSIVHCTTDGHRDLSTNLLHTSTVCFMSKRSVGSVMWLYFPWQCTSNPNASVLCQDREIKSARRPEDIQTITG
jgi:hypothetical protein